jgi:hypothetical protein
MLYTMCDDLTFLSMADVLVEVGETNNPGSLGIAILCQTLNRKVHLRRIVIRM